MKDAEKDITVSLADLCMKHRQAGIKEVVEEMEQPCIHWTPIHEKRECDSCWEAQKRKWGL